MSDWRTILAIDHDAKACEVYSANINSERVECGSVVDLIPTMPDADVILGGPPCQPYSSAGKQKGAGDVRDCVPDFCAAVEKVGPRMFLMEEVNAFAEQQKFQPVLQRTVARLTAAGYDVQLRVLDAVDFGVPQFRRRAWLWGVRKDLPWVLRHRKWPTPTHCDPATVAQPSMFGCDLVPWVTVGEALGLDAVGQADRIALANRGGGNGNKWSHGPSCTIDGGGLDALIQSHADPARTINAPAPALRSGGDGHDGCCVRVHEYRWSDAMLEKHPPASPASPAPTVQAKWSKGGAEGLVTVSTKQKRTTRGVDEPATALASDSRHSLTIRRLTPTECARLQSMPDDFVWPESVKKTHRYRIIGNGWASLMAKRMSEAFRAADPSSRTVIDLFCGGGCGAVGWHGRAWELAREEARAAS